MNEQENMRVVEQVYTAFGRGDIPVILNMLAENIDWLYPGPADIPYAGRHRGREQVAQFFATIGQTAEVEQFEPQEFTAQGDKVVVLGHERARAKPTGRSWETNWADVFTLREGKIMRIRGYYDTAAKVAAFRGD